MQDQYENIQQIISTHISELEIPEEQYQEDCVTIKEEKKQTALELLERAMNLLREESKPTIQGQEKNKTSLNLVQTIQDNRPKL